jgi:hypothetical protein
MFLFLTLVLVLPHVFFHTPPVLIQILRVWRSLGRPILLKRCGFRGVQRGVRIVIRVCGRPSIVLLFQSSLSLK